MKVTDGFEFTTQDVMSQRGVGVFGVQGADLCCRHRRSASPGGCRYIISCTLGQKAGAGLHITSSCRWEEATDGKLAVQWESATMQIIVITYWLAI